jgi:hypothetical protein
MIPELTLRERKMEQRLCNGCLVLENGGQGTGDYLQESVKNP